MRVPCYEPRRHPIGTLCVVRGTLRRPTGGSKRHTLVFCDGEHMNHYVIVS
jgi:hypothetical protein